MVTRAGFRGSLGEASPAYLRRVFWEDFRQEKGMVAFEEEVQTRGAATWKKDMVEPDFAVVREVLLAQGRHEPSSRHRAMLRRFVGGAVGTGSRCKGWGWSSSSLCSVCDVDEDVHHRLLERDGSGRMCPGVAGTPRTS